MKMTRTALLCLALAGTSAFAGCDDDEKKPSGPLADGGATLSDGGATLSDGAAQTASAKAILASTGAIVGASPSTASGTVSFTRTGGTIAVQISVVGAVPGDHGIHIHANGSCANTTNDAGVTPAGGAGAHWNPASMMHGQIGTDAGMHHAGDLGNITVTAGGQGTKSFTTTEWTLADLIGKAVVLHASADDLVTDPTGNSGGRIACGVIAAD